MLTENSSVGEILTSSRCKTNYGRLRSICSLRINPYSPERGQILSAVTAIDPGHVHQVAQTELTETWPQFSCIFESWLWFTIVSSTFCRSDSIRAKCMKCWAESSQLQRSGCGINIQKQEGNREHHFLDPVQSLLYTE